MQARQLIQALKKIPPTMRVQIWQAYDDGTEDLVPLQRVDILFDGTALLTADPIPENDSGLKLQRMILPDGEPEAQAGRP